MQSERKVVAILEAEGWIVERVKGSTKWSKSVDFFGGRFDIIAVRPTKPYIAFIQVKSRKLKFYPTKSLIASLKSFWNLYGGIGSVELWCLDEGRKKPRIIKLDRDATIK